MPKEKIRQATLPLLKKNDLPKSGIWARWTIRLSAKERLNFTNYLAVLLRAGLAIDEALEILLKQSKGPLRRIVLTLHAGVKRGETLADGLTAYPQVFEPVYVNLVRAGESSATLRENLSHLVEQLQKEEDLRQKIRSAMVYPIVIVVAAVAVTVGIVLFVLPNVLKLFTSLDVELPLPTRILLWISMAITERGEWVLSGVVAAFFVVGFGRRVLWIRPVLHRLLLRLPVIGGLSKKTNLARVTRLMGLMLKSGLTIDDCVPIAAQALKNARYQFLFATIKKEIAQGNSFTSVIERFPHLVPPMAVRMIYVGEQAGSLSSMFLMLAEFYEREVDIATRNLASLVEPFLLVVIGVLVGGLAISILLPIYQLVGQF